MTINNFFSLLICFCTSLSIGAQGIICHTVNDEGEKIEGYFIKQTPKELRLRDFNTQTTQVLDLAKINSYTLSEANKPDRTFVKVILNQGKPQFLERLAAGKLHLYMDRRTVSIDKPTPSGKLIKSVKNSTVFFLSKGTTELEEIEEVAWAAIISTKLHDCPVIVSKLNKPGYQYKDMGKIIQEYNNCQ